MANSSARTFLPATIKKSLGVFRDFRKYHFADVQNSPKNVKLLTFYAFVKLSYSMQRAGEFYKTGYPWTPYLQTYNSSKTKLSSSLTKVLAFGPPCTISLKDNDQRQSVDLTQVGEDCEEYRQQLLERPVVGAHEVESHFNSCSPSSSHGSADPWSSSCVVDEISELEVFSQSKQNNLTDKSSEFCVSLLWIKGEQLIFLMQRTAYYFIFILTSSATTFSNLFDEIARVGLDYFTALNLISAISGLL